MPGAPLDPSLDAIRRRFRSFVQDVVIPAEPDGLDEHGEVDAKRLATLRDEAKAREVWLPHMPTAYGGLGYGTMEMAIVSQELGASPLGPLACNASAPDEGNMHTLEAFGTDAQKETYLRPLTEGRIRSCFAMTEPDAGSDPTLLRTTARDEGDAWVLDGEKWFITGADGAAFAIVVAATDPDADRAHDRYSLILVETDNPGWTLVRRVPVMGTHAPGGHCHVRLKDCRVPKNAVLGAPGKGFEQAQVRLGGGRIAHAMRWIGAAQRALDLAAERATTREAFGGPLARHQAIQWMLADSATDLHVSRLLVMDAARKIDAGLDHRQEIAMLKVFVANALHRVIDRAIQIHGSLGYSEDTPLARFYRDARAARIYDGPDEVHQMVIGREVVRALARDGTTAGAAGGWP